MRHIFLHSLDASDDRSIATAVFARAGKKEGDRHYLRCFPIFAQRSTTTTDVNKKGHFETYPEFGSR